MKVFFRQKAVTVCLSLICLLAVSACQTRQPKGSLEGASSSSADGPGIMGGVGGYGAPAVADLARLPQDLMVYAAKAGGQRLLLDPAAQAEQDTRFNRLFFAPWDGAKASTKASEAFGIFGTRGESHPRGWAENLQPWTPAAWSALAANANRQSFPSRRDPAVTVRPTVLRQAPTNRPRFGNPASAGEGFPFDLFMYASVPTGMPLLVIHSSTDGAWLFVENSLLGGWVPAKDVALTDSAFQKKYQNGRYAAILRDDVSLRDAAGRYVTTAHLGSILPVERESASGLVLLAPAREPLGRAVLVPVHVPASDAAKKPLPLSPEALARIGNRMMGQAYGWGGLYENRDCSLMLRDLFTPFGVWLPRNSAAQAKAWDYITFASKKPAAKEEMILDKALPFATLLWLRGHIALYVGQYEGKAIMFHDMWGLRTEKGGQEGRHVVGRVVVTTTSPGAELPNIKSGNNLLERMEGMSLLR